MVSGRRPLTTNIIYKIFEPKEGYQIIVNGSIKTVQRVVQPSFNNIVIFQLIMSILGWGFLAFTLSKYIKNPFMKTLSAVVVVMFAYTPQMADWDSILMSESFTFSLFALQLAVLIRIVFLIYKDANSNPRISLHIVAWAVIYFLWTFLRDTNLFASFVTIGMVAVLLFSIKYRKNKLLHGMLVLTTGMLIFGLVTSSGSTRSQVQLINIYRDDLLLSPARVSTLKTLGMPDPDSAGYPSWFKENSAKTLIKFMLIHPGYPAAKIINDFPQAFTEISQTYFKAPEQYQARKILSMIGDALHPENSTPFLLDSFLLLGLILLAVKNTQETSRPWAWLATWLFLTASTTLIAAILGDTWALNRHALFSTMIYRLFMWTFSIIIIDVALQENAHQPSLSPEQE
jgi:hypothetical protein